MYKTPKQSMELIVKHFVFLFKNRKELKNNPKTEKWFDDPLAYSGGSVLQFLIKNHKKKNNPVFNPKLANKTNV